MSKVQDGKFGLSKDKVAITALSTEIVALARLRSRLSRGVAEKQAAAPCLYGLGRVHECNLVLRELSTPTVVRPNNVYDC